jgi:hypothetical protein
MAPGQPESFVFPVAVSLDETAMKIDNATILLTPGMPSPSKSGPTPDA